MNLTFCRPSDAKIVSAFESLVFLHVLVRCSRDLAHWGRLFETPFFRYVSVHYGRLKDIRRLDLTLESILLKQVTFGERFSCIEIHQKIAVIQDMRSLMPVVSHDRFFCTEVS